MCKLKWFICNAVLFCIIYLWLIKGNQYAGNGMAFLVWLHFLTSLFTLNNKVSKALKEKGPSINPKFNMLVDLSFAVVMACFGHFVYATLWFLGGMLQFGMYEEE